MSNIAIIGAGGRMGKALIEAISVTRRRAAHCRPRAPRQLINRRRCWRTSRYWPQQHCGGWLARQPQLLLMY